MTIKSVYLDNRQLKGLLIDIEFIASEELKEEIKEAIKDNEGKYLINILSNDSLRELNELRKNYLIKVLLNVSDN